LSPLFSALMKFVSRMPGMGCTGRLSKKTRLRRFDNQERAFAATPHVI
jgi:hypothetical protein